jgi:hypothetical protein
MSGLKQQNFDNIKHGENICPILDNPEPDCYCSDLNSLTIPHTVKYCLNHFRACSIYQRIQKEERTSRALSSGRKCKPLL